MKPLSLIAFLLIFFCCSDSDDAMTDGPKRFSVVDLGDFPGANRVFAVGFSVNGRGYIYGGRNGWIGGVGPMDRGFDDIWEYTPSANTWVRRPDYPNLFFPMVIGNTVYICESHWPLLTLSFSIYNVTTGTSTKITDFPGTNQYFFAMVIGGKIYAGDSSNDWWEYDPSTNEWHQKSSFPSRARFYYSWSIGKRGYLAFGTEDVGYGLTHDDFWEYDPAKDSWTEKGAKGLTSSNFFERVVFSRTIGDKPTMFLGTTPDVLRVYQYNFDAEEWKVEYEWENKYNGGMAGFSIGSSHYFLLGQTKEITPANLESSNKVVVFKE